MLNATTSAMSNAKAAPNRIKEVYAMNDTDNKEMFNDVLDEGETVLGVWRPNKKKYWAYFNWLYFWSMCWVALTFVFVPLAGIEEEDSGQVILWCILIGLAIAFAVYLIGYFIARIFAKLAYKKRYYAYTNKRILIRCGVIGVDYRVLDYKLLGAITVTVGILDRMLGGKTGYIRFGSASSPIIGGYGGNLGFGGFTFAHIDMPYDLLREIKKTINTAQEKEPLK